MRRLGDTRDEARASLPLLILVISQAKYTKTHKENTPTASLHLTALKHKSLGCLSLANYPIAVLLISRRYMSIKLSKVMNTVKHSSPQSIRNKMLASHNELRFNIDLQPGPIAGAHCLSLSRLCPKSLSLCSQASCMHATTSPVAISHCIVPLQPALLSLLPLALPFHDIAP